MHRGRHSVERKRRARWRKNARQGGSWRGQKRAGEDSSEGGDDLTDRGIGLEKPWWCFLGGWGDSGEVSWDIRGEAEDLVLVRRLAAHNPAANLYAASALPLVKGLFALVWAEVQEMEMDMSRLTWWSKRAWMLATMLMFASGRIERVAKSLTQ